MTTRLEASKRVCPLMDGKPCQSDDCMWWVIWNDKDPNPWQRTGDCIVRSISNAIAFAHGS